jgi:serine protease Do
MWKLTKTLAAVVVIVALTVPAAPAQRAALVESFAPVVKKAQPAVVNISTTVVRRVRGAEVPDFFEYFFGPGFRPPREQRGQSLGSGVMVRPDGYLLTNAHVVEGATDIRVATADRREFKAQLVGSDPQTDIAVLKIEGSGFPTIPFGDSSRIEVGDIVLAIGNPFGIGQTVTMGIVGAVGRSGLNIEAYEDFIQTDAAINPGNSGGALINTKGELIGINTAILSRSGGNQGIGFAVPVNMARNVMEQIIKSGKVVRGYMGAGIQDVTPDLAKGFGLKQTAGVAITQVEPNSPAEKAGLRAGDVVTALNGQPVNSANELRLRVSQTPPGTTVKLKVVREDGSESELPVTLAQLPSRGESGSPAQSSRRGRGGALEGVEVEDLTPRVARQLGLPRDVTGVVVVDVDPASPAAAAGLRSGDVIQRVNRQPVESVADFNRLVRQAEGKPVLLLVNRGGRTAFIVVEAAK